MDDAISFCALSKRYGAHTALRSVSFRVPAGSTFGLVGLNGAGKTTLIKCLLDFIAADDGEVRIFGLPAKQPASRDRLAYLSERFIPPPHLTGFEYLEMMATMYEVTTTQEILDRAAAAVDLDPPLLRRQTRAYSKGMGQKLGLAGLLMSNRPLLVLDEPMSGLDPRARAMLKAALRAAHARGATVFFTSHALADIDELCDSCVVIHQGAVAYTGTAASLRAQSGAATLEEAFLHLIDGTSAA
jgi:ABC-2 type transport system ATP-binding protein